MQLLKGWNLAVVIVPRKIHGVAQKLVVYSA